MDKVFKSGTPEEVGIASSDIRSLLKMFFDEGLYMHSLLIIRHGKLVAEGYYAPFTRESKHRMYSASKSFVSGAIGLLCDEGKIRLSDKVHSFFPEFPEAELHPFMREATVRDLLMMASPHEDTYSLRLDGAYGKKWIESYFMTKPQRPPGTIFRYDTSGTYILGVIAERVTGKPFLRYMQEKMLSKLGFSEDAWCVQSPEGYSWGGSGVICTPLDMAKYAYILLQKGNINGEQLLSETYVREATSAQIPTDNLGHSGVYRTSGYGYQIWRAPENGFAFSGLGDQYAYVVPEKDLLLVCTGDNQGKLDAGRLIFDGFRRFIVQKAVEKSLPENLKEYELLREELSSLKIRVPEGKAHSSLEEKLHNKTFELEENPLDFKTVRFTFEGNKGTLHYENARGKKSILFGCGFYETGSFPEVHYSGSQIGVPKGEGYHYLATAVWHGDAQLLLRVNIMDDYFGNLSIVFGFRDDKIAISASKTAECFLDDYVGMAGGRLLNNDGREKNE